VSGANAAKQSSSHVQQAAEDAARAQLSKELGLPLEPGEVRLAGGATVRVDATAIDGSVFAEIFARQGSLKTGQRHKIATDALKLLTIGRSRPDARLIIAMCDETAHAGILGWLRESLETAGIEMRVVPLPADLRASIVNAQRKQKMINPAVDGLAADVAR
jgi:hypothetical protein